MVVIQFPLAAEKGRVVVIELPTPLTPDEWANMMKTIESMKPVAVEPEENP